MSHPHTHLGWTIKTFITLITLSTLGSVVVFYFKYDTLKRPLLFGHFCNASTFSPTYPFYKSPLFFVFLLKNIALFLLYKRALPQSAKAGVLHIFLIIHFAIFLVFFFLYNTPLSAIFASFSYEYLLSKQHFGNMYLFPFFQILVYVLFYFYEKTLLTHTSSGPSPTQSWI